jgi:surface protein
MNMYMHRWKVRVCKWVRVRAFLRTRARADDALICGICASATRSLCSAIVGTSTYTGYVYTKHACIYRHARLATPTNGSPMRARRTHARTCCVRARARVCDWARTQSAPTPASAFPSAWTAGGAARQAFQSASAFNADIGAWNTASVSNMASVCAAFPTRAARHRRRDALGWVVGVARAVERGGDRRCARAGVCADVRARACAGVHVCRYSCAYERRDVCMYVYIYVFICNRYMYASYVYVSMSMRGQLHR